LNPRPSPWQGDALPLRHSRGSAAYATGFPTIPHALEPCQPLMCPHRGTSVTPQAVHRLVDRAASHPYNGTRRGHFVHRGLREGQALIEPRRTSATTSGAPDLREQVSAARDRISELLLVVVGISGGIGLVTNLLVSWVHDGYLSDVEWVTLLGAAAVSLALAAVASARLRLSTRELDEEIELAVPLLVSMGNTNPSVAIVQVGPYSEVTDLAHAAVAHLSAEEASAFALAARRLDKGPGAHSSQLTLVHSQRDTDDDGEDDAPSDTGTVVISNDPVLWFLQLTQLLVAAACLDESERLLGIEALFHRGRWLRRRTPHLREQAWSDLVATAGTPQPFLAQKDLPNVRQRSTVPAPARLMLHNVGTELATAKAGIVRRRQSRQREREREAAVVPLLTIEMGRTGWLSISGVARISAHGTPRVAQPAAGMTTRVFLRNARDNLLRQKALQEEAVATLRSEGGVPRPGIRPPLLDTIPALGRTPEELTREHHRAWHALYRESQRPRVARVYLAVQGQFRVRLSGRGSAVDQSLYAWSAALARRIGSLDVDALMERLAARQQLVPHRRF
jgi:hypothetical protein